MKCPWAFMGRSRGHLEFSFDRHGKGDEKGRRDVWKPFEMLCFSIVFEGFSKIQPILLVSFSMLIKIELQMAFRSVQKRPRTPQDARPPPTWSQHGANMGSKRSAKIGPRGLEIWSRGGLRPESLSDFSMDPKRTQNAPHMIPKHTPNGPQIDSQIDFRWTIHRLPNRLQRHSQIRSQIQLFTS